MIICFTIFILFPPSHLLYRYHRGFCRALPAFVEHQFCSCGRGGGCNFDHGEIIFPSATSAQQLVAKLNEETNYVAFCGDQSTQLTSAGGNECEPEAAGSQQQAHGFCAISALARFVLRVGGSFRSCRCCLRPSDPHAASVSRRGASRHLASPSQRADRPRLGRRKATPRGSHRPSPAATLAPSPRDIYPTF